MAAPAPEYVLARKTLLDALDVLSAQRDSLILVGAQAVYVHAPSRDARPTYTTDADLAINPDLLAATPDMGALLEAAGFRLNNDGNPGSWRSPEGVVVDLLVPESRSRRGHRAAPLAGQYPRTARSAAGLEVALHDHDVQRISALDPSDDRSTSVRVAGPAALFVAKSFKLRERLSAGRVDRILPKDAGDLLRLMRNADPAGIGHKLRGLAGIQELQGPIEAVVSWLGEQSRRGARGDLIGLAMDDRAGVEPASQVARSFALLTADLVEAFRSSD